LLYWQWLTACPNWVEILKTSYLLNRKSKFGM
jgi:hypothetical protein